MAGVTISIPPSEVQDLIRQVNAWQVKRRVQIGELIERTVKAIAEDARAAAPERTGDLKKKIRAGFKRAISDLEGEVSAPVFYARFVELGTVDTKAHPFLKPAFDKHMPQFFAELQRILNTV